MDAPNLQGTTPREILKRVENLLFDQPQHTPGRPSLFEPSSTDMSEWKWKLMSESMDEYQEMYGQYEDDFLGPAPEAETFEAWADRISQEYQARHCKSRHHYTEAQKDPIEANPKDLEVQKFKEREKQFAKEREHAQRECYRKRCDDVFGRLVTDKIDVHKKEINKDSKTVNTEKEEGNTSNSTRTHASLLGYSDIPWPVRGGTAEQMARYIAAGADSSNPSIYKRYLRAQQVTWHPDRFLQRCGSRLQAEDSKLILRTVTALSQELNRLAEQVK
ncbi:hypothetical protein GDO86_015644 [Hymenochirus boettgeri]|nr:hypothetical protein GDO86_015644 [Hymenochirus boettgeri]